MSNIGERAVLLANLIETNSNNNNNVSHVEETDSGVDSERGEKRKSHDHDWLNIMIVEGISMILLHGCDV